MAGAKQYRVVGSVAVIRKGKHEQYLGRGVIFGADRLNEDNAKHLLARGLIAEHVPEKADAPERAAGK